MTLARDSLGAQVFLCAFRHRLLVETRTSCEAFVCQHLHAVSPLPCHCGSAAGQCMQHHCIAQAHAGFWSNALSRIELQSLQAGALKLGKGCELCEAVLGSWRSCGRKLGMLLISSA